MAFFRQSMLVNNFKRERRTFTCGLLLLIFYLLTCEQAIFACEEISEPASLGECRSETVETALERLGKVHLPNAIQVHPKVISGGLPADKSAFSELRQLGVKTIISVDGQIPDAKLAREYEMRYVHLPHGYNGISPERINELAKAVRDLPGPIYVHCHHGKHRSPTASAVACVAAGFIPPEKALSILRFAGTSPHYQGLYAAATTATPIDQSRLDELSIDFKERSATAPLVESMVSIERIFANLGRFQKNEWKHLSEHPDLMPEHQALLLKEHFREISRLQSDYQTEDYLQLLKSSESSANQLELQIRKLDNSHSTVIQHQRMRVSMTRLKQQCQQCHRRFRDLPNFEPVKK